MKIPNLYNAKSIFGTTMPRVASFSSKKYPNLMPLEKDTVSFTSKVEKANLKSEKQPIIIENLNDPVLDSIQEVTKNHDTYIVGGYMRDYFNGKVASHDWDLVCTDNSRALAQEIAELKQGTFIPLDEEYGIYRVVLPDKVTSFDIAQAQDNDVYVDSRRRDLTINSIFYNLNTHEVYDPFNGVEDIQNRVIRTSSLDNMKSDPLRMLRTYRFAAKTGFSVDKELSQYCKENFSLIKDVATERVNSEIMNIFSAKYSTSSLNKMNEDGVLKILFPSVSDDKEKVSFAIDVADNIPQTMPLLKIVALYLNSEKSIDAIIEELKSLKFPKKSIQYMSKILLNMSKISSVEKLKDKQNIAGVIKELGDYTEDALMLAKAQRMVFLSKNNFPFDKDTEIKQIEECSSLYQKVKSVSPDYKPLLNGREIAKILNVSPSQQLGIMMCELQKAQLMGEVISKEDAQKYIEYRYLNK